MSYEPTVWETGDTVTSIKLNKLEQAVADASGGSELPEVTSADNGKVLGVVEGEWDVANASGGGGVLIVRGDTTTGILDKTWQEINDAGFAVLRDYVTDGNISLLVAVWNSGEFYGVGFYNLGDANPNVMFVSDSAEGYPHYVSAENP